ncbi:hypothetical protein [Leptolyngbya sp. FACHB-261]|uniref:hypothetical protein n=1 Tax=Leptolyngbya sp. FACHB-261 TaxID=2692806 RepID=UPI0016849AEE|nr:hypothetical protein [Leptolyngbya sp. FACHB-261]MBD2102316.1 hypothetical protein [Leptolyngbya sp. FACHB-261]
MENIFQYLAEILEAVGDNPTALAALMFVLLAVLASLLFKGSQGLSGLLAFIALLAFAFFLVITFNKASAPTSQNQIATNPLRVGLYRANNNYLEILQRGERICMRVTSRNGSTVASVHVDPQDPDSYGATNYEDSTLKQKSPTTISFVGFIFTEDNELGFSQEVDDVEQECLDSTRRFFLYTPPDEGR